MRISLIFPMILVYLNASARNVVKVTKMSNQLYALVTGAFMERCSVLNWPWFFIPQIHNQTIKVLGRY